MDLKPGRNIYLTSCFISVCVVLTDRDMSVVPTCVWDAHHIYLHPGRNVYLTSWFILSMLFFGRR